ncbi:annexin D4-like [Humulus lupulus]|uniref:annexin D4-like n=1 Tax=Humulus lupulus TaxID=3486 RepID=UPI002B4033A9|nr:annexin D4-like [Humulus lupulus]
MALSDKVQNVITALSGLGVDEKSLIDLGKWDEAERTSFRENATDYFQKDEERDLEHWREGVVKDLKRESLRFNNAVVWWTMHPWERDARLADKAFKKKSYGILVEIACTRSSNELLGARKAYHSLFEHSLEEDVYSKVTTTERKLLVALVSAYRYEGAKVTEAEKDAKALAGAIEKKKNLVEEEEVLRILTTKSKPHLIEVYKQYHILSQGKNLDEDIGDLILQETVQCLCAPQKYFASVLVKALQKDADKSVKRALTRVIVTRADNNMKDIKEEFKNKGSDDLSSAVEKNTKGNYKDFLLALIDREK